MDKKYVVRYYAEQRLFEIVFSNNINEDTIIDCQREFRTCFEKNYQEKAFKILLDATGYRHNNLALDRKIRMTFNDGWQPGELENCVACAIVNDDHPAVDYRLEYNTNEKEWIFENRESALEWLDRS